MKFSAIWGFDTTLMMIHSKTEDQLLPGLQTRTPNNSLLMSV
jgi:hypothetical protein